MDDLARVEHQLAGGDVPEGVGVVEDLRREQHHAVHDERRDRGHEQRRQGMEKFDVAGHVSVAIAEAVTKWFTVNAVGVLVTGLR